MGWKTKVVDTTRKKKEINKTKSSMNGGGQNNAKEICNRLTKENNKIIR